MARPTQDRTEAILAAARTQFRATGAERTTVDDIAARAGVGKGTVFLYWPSKARLRESVLLLEIAKAFAALADDLRNDPALLRLGTIVRHQIAACLDNPDVAPLMRGQPLSPPSRIVPPVQALHRIISVMRAHQLIVQVGSDEIATGIETLLAGALVRGLDLPGERDLILKAAERLVASAYEHDAADRNAVKAALPGVLDALEDAIDQLVEAATPDRPTTARLRPRERPHMPEAME